MAQFPVIFNGQNYDLKKFLGDHPGGVNTLKNFRGKDVLQAMAKFGHSRSAYHILGDFKLAPKDMNVSGVSESGRIITNKDARKEKETAFLEELRADDAAPMSLLHFLYHLATGVLHWTALEYVLHRWVFHLDPGSSITMIKIHFLIHGLHHKMPFDGLRQVFPPLPGLLLAYVIYAPVRLLLAYPLIKMAGGLAGYVVYDMIHFYVHHGSPRAGTYLYAMKRYHSNHHFLNHDKGILFVFCAVEKLSVSGCFNTGWESLFLDLFHDVCPLLASSTSKVCDLFTLPSVEDSYAAEYRATEYKTEEKRTSIASDVIADCLRCGRELAKAAKHRGNQLVRSGISLDASSPAMQHFFWIDLAPETKQAVQASHNILAATKLLQMQIYSCGSPVTPGSFLSFLESQVVRAPAYVDPLGASCRRSDRYRTLDGSCNNLAHPAWGRRDTPYTRIAEPRYADGIYAMPVGKSGRQLPNARVLSTRLFSDQPIPSRRLSYLNMQWGQLVTHDLALQGMEITDEGPIQCCVGTGEDVLPAEWLNDKCIPICVPDDDPFYRYSGTRCLNFVRSLTVPRLDGSLGHAEQMNLVTSYLDGSFLYGAEKKLASKLRSKRGGRLKEESRTYSRRGFLPTAYDKAAMCDLRNSSEPCYFAGDVRSNQTPTLALLQTLLLREHNRVADILSELNPSWNDEKLYQEARRIVIAEIQHITYQEWLPLNFGENYFRYYRISPSTLYNHDYSPDVNAGVINSFAAAAFRFLHSIVPDSFMACPASYQTGYLYKLSDHYFNPSLLESSPSAFDDLVRGILTQSSAESDPFCTGEVTNLLFKSYNRWGLDLISMDIQRGRDHGLAAYNDYREICGLRRATTFQDLAGEISQDRISALAQLYESVDDVELLVGGALEGAVPGSLLGPTLQCVVAEQFYRSRVGDRFFYDNSDMPHSFTAEQLQEIKKASMARLICDNTDGVQFVQRKAFEMESAHNPKYGCDDYNAIPRVDLTAWGS